MIESAVLWQWVDRPGHESAKLAEVSDGWQLRGNAVLAHEGSPCALTYLIECDREWRTQSARVAGWVGAREIAIEIAADAQRRWSMNGTPMPELDGILDIDLNFSPSTNLMPIRRLDPTPGAEAELRAAWLRFPSFALEPLAQRYRRIDATHVLYQSIASGFEALLTIDEDGLVIDYPGIWRAARK